MHHLPASWLEDSQRFLHPSSVGAQTKRWCKSAAFIQSFLTEIKLLLDLPPGSLDAFKKVFLWSRVQFMNVEHFSNEVFKNVLHDENMK